MFSQGEGIAAGWPPQVPLHSHSQSEAILSREWGGFVYIATAVVLLNVLAGGKGSRRRNQKLMMNIVGFFSRYTYHSLLVVQESISIAYWSSQLSVPQRPRTFVLTSASQFYPEGTHGTAYPSCSPSASHFYPSCSPSASQFYPERK